MFEVNSGFVYKKEKEKEREKTKDFKRREQSVHHKSHNPILLCTYEKDSSLLIVNTVAK